MRLKRVRISFGLWLCAAALAGVAQTFVATSARAETSEPQALPDTALAAVLVRTTLLSLNEANLTANYSVLRAGSAPDFQRVYSEKRLAGIFQILREKRVDLAPAAMSEPVIKSARYVAARRAVVFEGTVPAAPSAVLRFETNFKFAYQYVDGRWRLFRLDLSLDPSKPLQTAGTEL